METNLFNQAFERQVIENESNETLWQLAQKKLGGNGDTQLTTDAVLKLAATYKISIVFPEKRSACIAVVGVENLLDGKNCTAPLFVHPDPVRAVLMVFLTMGKVNNG